MRRPFYIVFAGVNGAGKSTLYHSDLWRDECMPKSMDRINPDEIIREIGGDWSSRADQKVAGKIALCRIDQCFKDMKSFNQETTLAGHLGMKNIVRAHDLGYRIFLLYVGIERMEIALSRIENRTRRGGHSIDERDVRRRFDVSLSNFALCRDLCEQAIVFDNTQRFTSLAQWSHGVLSWWGRACEHGQWLLDAMRDETRWLRTCNGPHSTG